MDFFNLINNSFIFCLISRSASLEPFIVSSPGYMAKFTKCSDRITMFFVFFFDCLVDMPMSDQA